MKVIVYGNGKSRQKWNVNEKFDDVTTWGCNAIFRDVKVDNLVSVDYAMQHKIYESGYAHKNKCWFADWNIIPEYFSGFDTISAENSSVVIENKKNNRSGCVINGKENEPEKGLYITWVDNDDMVENIEYPKEWSAGTTATHLACQQGAKEIYLIGFDLNDDPINNVYEREYNLSYKYGYRKDWESELKTTIKEYKDVNFVWAINSRTSYYFNDDNLTYDTYDNIRRNICR